MKLGAENRTKTVVAAALLALGLLLFVRTFLVGGTQASVPQTSALKQAQVPEIPGGQPAAAQRPLPTTMRRGNARRGQPKKPGEEPISISSTLDPRLRLDLLATAEQTQYSGSGRNIFLPEADPVIPTPVAPAMRPPEPQPSGPPQPPPPPPINLKFFGFASSAGQPKRVFLSQGEDIFVASEGEIVNRRYKIVHIGDTSVEVEDMLSNRRQSLPLTT